MISPYRLDFMAKLLWIEAMEGKYDRTCADKLYGEHILAFSNYLMVEPGQLEKAGLENYCNTFHKICKAVQETDGNVLKIGNPIPVDGKFMAMDGAHRISAAVYYGKSVPVYLVKKVIPNQYDYRFFQRKFLEETYVLEMVKKYISMRTCRLYLLKKEQMNRRMKGKIEKECSPVYMKKLKSGEWFVIVDCIWMKEYGSFPLEEQLSANCCITGQVEIISWLEARRGELTEQKKWQECRKNWGICFLKYGNCFKIRVKRLLRRTV